MLFEKPSTNQGEENQSPKTNPQRRLQHLQRQPHLYLSVVLTSWSQATRIVPMLVCTRRRRQPNPTTIERCLLPLLTEPI